MNPLPAAGLSLWSDFTFDDATDEALAPDLLQRACAYLTGTSWCARIDSIYVGGLVAPIYAVFLFHIEALDEAEPWVWVVTGDLPTQYVEWDPQWTPTATLALRSYIFHLRRWVEAVFAGEPQEGLMDPGVPANRANATALASRLDFLERNVLT